MTVTVTVTRVSESDNDNSNSNCGKEQTLTYFRAPRRRVIFTEVVKHVVLVCAREKISKSEE